MIPNQMRDQLDATIDGPAAAPLSAPAEPAPDGREWWRSGLIYQVYPRSFSDTNGDGVGDLAGLINHLDYLNDGSPASLGIDAIWLSPIYPSAGFDLGYDVSDYTAIDPLFGDLTDFDRLVAEAHRRGIRLILDQVLNHTSYLHPWFVASRSARTGPRADWYLWRDPAGYGPGGRPRRPNNWVSFFGGPAWTWDEVRRQFYLHTFLPEQPDLNWRNPGVRAALLDVIRTWLGRGVDGLRFDVFNAFYKHAELLSNPYRPGGRRAYSRQVHLYDKNQPELLELLAEIRRIVDERPGRMTVGELFEGSVEQAASYAQPGHLIFDFSLIHQPWTARAFARAVAEREAAFGPQGWPTVVMSNHDQPRSASRYDRADGDARARVAATMLLTLRGTPFLYYGEEIGLRDVDIPRDEIQDLAARRSKGWWNRDQARAPMPWGSGPNDGFSTGRPWLRMSPEGATRNVSDQLADPDSILSHYRRLAWLRRSSPALSVGSYQELAIGDSSVFAYLRRAGGQSALVLLGFGRRSVPVALPPSPSGRPWRAALSTHAALPAGVERTELRPLEAVILVDD
jgi:alpha-glucosidase